jgi:hypothetical protein
MANPEIVATEPLKPEPKWTDGGAAGWYDSTGRVTGGTFVPRVYADGFEDGAFALGKQLYNLMAAGRMQDVFDILVKYNNDSANPIKGWATKPPRG